LTAALVLALAFFLITIVALLCCIVAQRRTVERAKLALATRSNAPWLDPKFMTVGCRSGAPSAGRSLSRSWRSAFLPPAWARNGSVAPRRPRRTMRTRTTTRPTRKQPDRFHAVGTSRKTIQLRHAEETNDEHVRMLVMRTCSRGTNYQSRPRRL